MKQFLTFFTFFFSLTLCQAQDTLITKSIPNLDKDFVSVSHPVYLNNQIIFFTSRYSDSLAVGDLKMITLDTSGNIIKQKSISITGHYGIYFAKNQNVLINQNGNFIILGLQYFKDKVASTVLEIDINGKQVFESHNTKVPWGLYLYDIFELKTGYVVQGMGYGPGSGDCGTPSPRALVYFLEKNGKIDSLDVYPSLAYLEGKKDSTILAFTDGSWTEINVKTGKSKMILYNYSAFAFLRINGLVRLKNNKWFVVGQANDTLVKKVGIPYFGVIDDNLKRVWSNRIPNDTTYLHQKIGFSKVQQNPYSEDLLLSEENFYYNKNKLSLHYVDSLGQRLWKRTDTIADFGVSAKYRDRKEDTYSDFCFLPNGNICTLLNSCYYEYLANNNYVEKTTVRFVKFTNKGQNSAILYKSAISASNEIVGTTIKIFPNPFSESTRIEAQISEEHNNLIFNLLDSNGRIIRSEKFSGNALDFQREGLQSGFYFYEIMSEKKRLGTGKLVVF